MRVLRVGDRVVKDPGAWTANDFDGWGRGRGIGEVVDPELPLDPGEADVRWPAGRCFENERWLLRYDPALEDLELLMCLLAMSINEGTVSLDRSKQIEGLIVTLLPDDHRADEVAEELAQYSPGGGHGLLSEAELLPSLSRLLARIRARGAGA